MPIVFRQGGLRYFFFSNEGSPREPPHVHVKGGGREPRAEGTAALKAEPEQKLSPAQELEHRSEARAHAKAAAAEKRAEAKARGYEGEACGECGNFTLVRNGTCLKCDTCGSTTGCS